MDRIGKPILIPGLAAGLLSIIAGATLAAAGEAPGSGHAATPAADACGSTPVVISYIRGGGIAGRFQRIYIHDNGCYAPGPDDSPTGQLSDSQLAWLHALQAHYRGFKLRAGDPPGRPDGMSTTLTFNGSGAEPAGPAQSRAILVLLAELLR